jgi:tetratricopeptide (TPR) repeat protein
LLADRDLYERDRFADYALSERAYHLLYKGPNTVRLPLRNRLLLETVFGGKLRGCFSETGSGNVQPAPANPSEQPVSRKAVDGVYSYVLNDYGNACLNYYLRYGDPAMLDDAISALEQSTLLYPINAVAYFNLATAYGHKNLPPEEIIECLDKAEKLVPAWPFVRTMSALQKVIKTRDEIDRSDYWVTYFEEMVNERQAKVNELKALQDTLRQDSENAQQSGPVTPVTSAAPANLRLKVENLFTHERQLRATPADRSQKLEEEITAAANEVVEYQKTLQTYQEELVKNEKMFLERSNDALANIFADTRLQPLFQQTGMAVVVETLHRLLVNNAIDWTRMNETDVSALRACAEVLSHSGRRNLTSLDCSRRLALHMLDRYYPEDFDTNAILHQIYGKLGNASIGYAMATLKPVTDYWLSQGTKDFVIYYSRFVLSLEPAVDHNGNNSKFARKHSLLGHVFSRLRRFDEAMAEYRLAIEEEPRCAAHHLRLAEIYAAQWQFDKELEELVEAQLLDPDNPQVREGLGRRLNENGNTHYRRGEWKQAVKQYEAAVKAAPYVHTYHSNLGLALEKLIVEDNSGTLLERAIKACQRAQALAPDNTEYSEQLERLITRQKGNTLKPNDHFGPRGPSPSPICLELSPQLVALFELTRDPQLSPRLQSYLDWMRDYHRQQYGVNVPEVRVFENTNLPEGHYAVRFYENQIRWYENQVPFASQEVRLDRRLFIGAWYLLEEVNVVGEETNDPLQGGGAYWIAREDWPKLARSASDLLGVGEFVIRHLTYLVAMNLSDFFGHQEVLELVKMKIPGLDKNLRENPDELKAFTTVLKALLMERVPIEPLAAIYDKFAGLHSAEVSLLTIVERVRQIPQVRASLPGNWDSFQYYRLSAAAESLIEAMLDNSGPQPVLAMEPEPCQTALTQVREFVNVRQRFFAIVTRKTYLRPLIRRLVELEFPHLWILSEEEMTEEMKKRIVANEELELTAAN